MNVGLVTILCVLMQCISNEDLHFDAKPHTLPADEGKDANVFTFTIAEDEDFLRGTYTITVEREVH